MTTLMPRPWLNGHKTAMIIAEGLRDDELIRPLRDGERRLGSFILPPFQRHAVWTRQQQVRLIESIWLDLPIGAYVVNTPCIPPYDCDDWLIDGQQRWTAIMAYVNGDFPVFGHTYHDLPVKDKRRFRQTPIARIDTKLTDPVKCREVYERLAYGGTPHEVSMWASGVKGMAVLTEQGERRIIKLNN